MTLTLEQLRKLIGESERFSSPYRDAASLGDDIESDLVDVVYTFYSQLAEERNLPVKSRDDVRQTGIDSGIASEARELALDWLKALGVNTVNDGMKF